MSEDPNEISVVALPEDELTPLDPLRSPFDRVRTATNVTNLKLDELAAGVNQFLSKMDEVFREARTSVGGYNLDEISISAGITAGGKVTLFGVAGAEAGLSGGLIFKFKKG
jgi:hypothetical protein